MICSAALRERRRSGEAKALCACENCYMLKLPVCHWIAYVVRSTRRLTFFRVISVLLLVEDRPANWTIGGRGYCVQGLYYIGKVLLPRVRPKE
jgi:hypothetical protein